MPRLATLSSRDIAPSFERSSSGSVGPNISDTSCGK
jgi:hypothetical protein